VKGVGHVLQVVKRGHARFEEPGNLGAPVVARLRKDGGVARKGPVGVGVDDGHGGLDVNGLNNEFHTMFPNSRTSSIQERTPSHRKMNPPSW
jgi:hypothetical protein